jgi:hypothetical protein
LCNGRRSPRRTTHDLLPPWAKKPRAQQKRAPALASIGKSPTWGARFASSPMTTQQRIQHARHGSPSWRLETVSVAESRAQRASSKLTARRGEKRF